MEEFRGASDRTVVLFVPRRGVAPLPRAWRTPEASPTRGVAAGLPGCKAACFMVENEPSFCLDDDSFLTNAGDKSPLRLSFGDADALSGCSSSPAHASWRGSWRAKTLDSADSDASSETESPTSCSEDAPTPETPGSLDGDEETQQPEEESANATTEESEPPFQWTTEEDESLEWMMQQPVVAEGSAQGTDHLPQFQMIAPAFPHGAPPSVAQPRLPPGVWAAASPPSGLRAKAVPSPMAGAAYGCRGQGARERLAKLKVPAAAAASTVPPPPTPVNVLTSVGSVGHPLKCAEACKYANKPKGCKDGASCAHCHHCTWKRFVAWRSGGKKRTSGSQ